MNVSFLNHIYLNVISNTLNLVKKFWTSRGFVLNSLFYFSLDLTIPNSLKSLSRNSLDEACRLKDIETLQRLNDGYTSECPEQVDF